MGVCLLLVWIRVNAPLITYSAVQFTTYEQLKKVCTADASVNKNEKKLTSFQSFLLFMDQLNLILRNDWLVAPWLA